MGSAAGSATWIICYRSRELIRVARADHRVRRIPGIAAKQAEAEFNELIHQPNTDVAEMMTSLRRFLGENDMMAHLTKMANRLLELHRVLKPTGSLYLHCDPTVATFLVSGK